ncbi:DUF397 domain-containing protein [Embleya hyalina]|uniref:Transcriptional regulator n=1 Tax=Embleya hyalina TaxID=516124 RepID=A0A401YV66_9ACTN|nr:DUF397 domain-containing protein [Embleya hyalina]GCD98512.1 transcriptional regulator [Embleya hyalina]
MRAGNGDAADSLGSVTWVKSSASTAEGNCVEVALLPGGAIAVRDSQRARGPALVYSRASLAGFVADSGLRGCAEPIG